MGLNHRLNICRAYFSQHRDFDCSLRDMLEKILSPTCTMIGKPNILKIIEDGAYKLIYLRNIKYPLYWPKDIPLDNLYMVISESLYENNWHYYEVPETQIKSGDVVLDCGAAEGLFSLKIMERAQCVVIEPSPVFIGSLKKTFYDKDNVHIMPYALSNREGQAYLSTGTLCSALTSTVQDLPTQDSLMVKTTTIDKLVRDLGLVKVDYIKGDLESFELEVLQGAVETIRNHKPKIALTTYHHGNNWKDMRDFVLSLVPGYAWRIKGLSYLNKFPKPVMIHFWPA
jgi:FkbM family methyltransferase